MAKRALNQRFATYEDIFVKFAVPVILQELNALDDVYYLYTPYKNLCPTKAQIESGLTLHYASEARHKLFLNYYNQLPSMVMAYIRNYYNYNSTETLSMPVITQKTLLLSLNRYTGKLQNTLRTTIIDICRYINTNYISRISLFRNYAKQISSNDFVIEGSKTGTAAEITLTIEYQKIGDPSEKLQEYIANINLVTVGDLIKIINDAIYCNNFDVIYTAYQLKGYKVNDISQAHKDGSLVRLCDISKRSNFYLFNNTTNTNIYDYNEYISFKDTKAIIPDAFKGYSVNVNSNDYTTGENISFKISNIELTSGISEEGTVTVNSIQSNNMYMYENANNSYKKQNTVLYDSIQSIDYYMPDFTTNKNSVLFYNYNIINMKLLLYALNTNNTTILYTNPVTISDLKNNNDISNIINSGGCIIPYYNNLTDGNICTVNTNFTNNQYNKFCCCFTGPNKGIAKRSMIVTFIQNDTNDVSQAIIHQKSVPLVITLSITDNNHKFCFDESKNPILKVLFQSDVHSLETDSAFENLFDIEYIDCSNTNITLKIYYNSYQNYIPETLTNIIIIPTVDNNADGLKITAKYTYDSTISYNNVTIIDNVNYDNCYILYENNTTTYSRDVANWLNNVSNSKVKSVNLLCWYTNNIKLTLLFSFNKQ